MFVYRPGQKMIIASADGRGFVAAQDEMVANTRKGRMLLNVEALAKATIIVAAEGDHVAAIGENRKLLVYPLNEIPEMTRGKGVRLQRYKDGGLSDIKTFAMADGLTWKDSAGRVFTVAQADLLEWIGHRAEAGRLPPKGFPKNNKFG